jgi:hypothetical protein
MKTGKEIMRLKTSKKEQWITVSAGEEEARFLVAPMTPKESFDIISQATEIQWEKGNQVEKANFFKMKMLRIHKVIRDWQAIEDENGAPIPCTKESRELVYLYNAALIDAALDKAAKLSNIFEQEKEDDLKNSEAGPSGTLSPA